MNRMQTPCPDWCERHHRNEQPHATFETHEAVLWVQRPPVAPDSWNSFYTLSQFAVSEDGESFTAFSPSITIMYNAPDWIPHTISAPHARELAAALIRGAEAIEQGLTAQCDTCGEAMHPSGLYDEHADPSPDGGDCSTCCLTKRKARQPRLVAVESE